MPDEPNPPLPEATKSEIWREVEHRFKNPPADFVERIEKEVEKRVAARVKQYRTLAKFVAAGVSVFAIGFGLLFWVVSIDKVRTEIDNQLTNSVAINAKNHLVSLVVEADRESANLSNQTETLKILQSGAGQQMAAINQMFAESAHTMSSIQKTLNGFDGEIGYARGQAKFVTELASQGAEDYHSIMECLNQLKNQDDVIVSEDLPKLFVVQAVTNLVDGNKIVLDYDPIPGSIRFRMFNTPFLMDVGFNGFGSVLNNRSITLTNPVVAKQFIADAASNHVAVEYFRASKTQ